MDASSNVVLDTDYRSLDSDMTVDEETDEEGETRNESSDHGGLGANRERSVGLACSMIVSRRHDSVGKTFVDEFEL